MTREGAWVFDGGIELHKRVAQVTIYSTDVMFVVRLFHGCVCLPWAFAVVVKGLDLYSLPVK